jgi:hypothetical protein
MSDDGAPAAANLDAALKEVTDHMTASARECVTALKTSLTTALDRKYTSEELAKDMAGFWGRGMRDMARAWTDAAKLAAAISALPSKSTAQPGSTTAPGAGPTTPPSTGSTTTEPTA